MSYNYFGAQILTCTKDTSATSRAPFEFGSDRKTAGSLFFPLLPSPTLTISSGMPLLLRPQLTTKPRRNRERCVGLMSNSSTSAVN